jgi:hypothetical protein
MASAAAIVDHDLLAEALRERRCDDARKRVDAAAWRIGHDETDRLDRVGVGCVGRHGNDRTCVSCRDGDDRAPHRSHSAAHHPLLLVLL